MRHVWTLMLCGVTACATPDAPIAPPPYRVGQVLAYSEAQAAEVDALVRKFEPMVREVLASNREGAEFWMLERSDLAGSTALTFDDRVLVSTSAQETLAKVVGHELGHWHSFVTELPYVVEEGVAVYVEKELGLSAPTVEAFDPTADWERIFSVTPEQWNAIEDNEEIQTMYLVAYWIVDEIGLDELRRMQAEGRTTAADLVRAAGLPSE